MNCYKISIILYSASVYFYLILRVFRSKSKELMISKSTERRSAKSHPPVNSKIF